MVSLLLIPTVLHMREEDEKITEEEVSRKDTY